VQGTGTPCRFEKDYKWLWKPKECAQNARITETTEMAMLQMTSWGYMQIMGAVGREFGLTGSILQLLEPKTNFKFACLLLKRLARKYKERSDIFAAYNAGSPIKTLDGKYKNEGYVDKVLDNLAAIEAVRGT
jgi:soluble lytic murein transglycosylase-like protein